MEATTETCVLCKEPLEEGKLPTVTRHEKGSDGISKARAGRNDIVQTVPGQRVHTDYRRTYPIKIAQARKEADKCPETDKKTCLLHSAEEGFSADCFYCATPVNDDNQRRRRVYYYPVTTLETKQTVLSICNDRQPSNLALINARPVLR